MKFNSRFKIIVYSIIFVVTVSIFTIFAQNKNEIINYDKSMIVNDVTPPPLHKLPPREADYR